MYCQRLVVVKEFTYLRLKLGGSEEWKRQKQSTNVQGILTFVRATDKILIKVSNMNVKVLENKYKMI